MKCFNLLLGALAAMALSANAQDVPVKSGAYTPDWENLGQWECPEWFKDVKFGIWAHWGPQCEAEAGDWYARGMYFKGSGQYNWHKSHYGDPAVFGFKDVINEWEAEEWNPEELVKLYYEAGARYFFTLGQHHDNFDLWDSPYQPWNSVNMGPKRDIVKGWSDACKKYGLKLGISMHGAHTWTWYEIAQDFDGNLTAADGAGKWWEGYDPQDLYAQRHTPSVGYQQSGGVHGQWDWGAGASLPSEAFKMKFQNRVLQCINDYNPDMLYFDDTVMPFWGCDDAVGLNILSHYYNHDAAKGGDGVVAMGKQLRDIHKQAMLWDVERGVPDRIQPQYWQTCTCIGSWHYDVSNTNYKSAQQVVCMLVDIVSKNGNLLLSVPIRGNGTIDAKERAVVEGIKAWMQMNGESIYGTRPWKTFGEGPLADAANPLTAQGFNESNNYSARDVRYVQRDGKLYATIMAWPALGGKFTFESLGYASPYFSGNVESVRLLGSDEAIDYSLDFGGLTVTLPKQKCNDIAPVFEIVLNENDVKVSYADFIAYFESCLDTMQANSGYMCTGKYDPEKVEALARAIDEAKALLNGPAEEQSAALLAVQQTYQDIRKNGTNAGGLCDLEGNDVTVKYQMEAEKFSRSSDSGTYSRFGKPKYWTVENFKIPNGGDGTKQGIDRYPGFNCLMLGVWDDQSRNADGDLADARIYRRVTLPAGCYFFGAKYNTTYNISPSAYIYVASENAPTAQMAENAIAFEPVRNAEENKGFYGIFFTLAEEQEVCIGFQADLTGASTQEFRVKEIQMLHIGDANFKCDDLTVEKLMEKENFSRFTATDDDSRFGKPLYWEVDNFNIPNGTDGTKQGIDRYPGYNCLMLGVWDDRDNNLEGNLADARIYRTIELEPGNYSFSAMFQTTYNISPSAYVFVAPEVVPTAQIPATAYTSLPIRECGENDGSWHSLKFKLDKPTKLVVGFAADLTGAAQQEFRVKAVRLQRIEGEVGVETVTVDAETAPARYYDISGCRLPQEPDHGLYLKVEGSRSSKHLKK